MTRNDYAPYLHITKDGHIWWLLNDAIRLGAGFLPVLDENQKQETRLETRNQRALVNEKTLIGAFGDVRLPIARPMMFERDGCRYVDAAGFLEWLSQYICQTQANIDFPDELTNQVRIALAKAAAERPGPATQAFENLTPALEDHFDKSLGSLPEALRQRVEQEFFPMPWDDLSVDQRRSAARQLDYRRDPATEADRQSWWNFFERKDALEQQIQEWERVPAPTAGELATRESRLRELRQELASMEQQQRQGPDDYRQERLASPCQPVSASQIRDHFRVIKDEDANETWWKTKMRDAKRCGLVDCRVGEGKKGQGEGSLWRPDLIATWLVERHDEGRQGLSAKAARSTLTKFPGCEAIAEELFPDPE